MLPGGDSGESGFGSAPVERFLEARAAVGRRGYDVGDSRFVLFEVDELAEAQIGYAVGVDDDDLTGDGPGQWRPLWLVVGEEEYSLDTLLVDLGDPQLAVLVAADDDEGWAPVEVAASFGSLAALLTELAAAAKAGAEPEHLFRLAEPRTPAAGRAYWRRWLDI